MTIIHKDIDDQTGVWVEFKGEEYLLRVVIRHPETGHTHKEWRAR